MKPPMHDKITLHKPIIIDGKIQKDGRGFPQTTNIDYVARVKEENTIVIDAQGQERNCQYTISVPPDADPTLQDEVTIKGITVPIIKATPRRSYSGKKIYYWVINSGA